MTAPLAVVAGAAAGIGKEIARNLSSRAYRVYALDVDVEHTLEVVLSDIEKGRHVRGAFMD